VTTREDASKAADWQGAIDDQLRFMDRIDKTIMALLCERLRVAHALRRLSREPGTATDLENVDDDC
jgi:hypothetical protein